MGMEGRGCDGRPPILLEEARVGLDAGELLSVHVEDLDGVRRRSTALMLDRNTKQIAKHRTYTANTGKCSWRLAVRSVSLVT